MRLCLGSLPQPLESGSQIGLACGWHHLFQENPLALRGGARKSEEWPLFWLLYWLGLLSCFSSPRIHTSAVSPSSPTIRLGEYGPPRTTTPLTWPSPPPQAQSQVPSQGQPGQPCFPPGVAPTFTCPLSHHSGPRFYLVHRFTPLLTVCLPLAGKLIP